MRTTLKCLSALDQRRNVSPVIGEKRQPLIFTVTNDPNVYPSQPRRFAAKMGSMNLPFYFREIPEGGHGLGSTEAEAARTHALIYTYLARQLIDPYTAAP